VALLVLQQVVDHQWLFSLMEKTSLLLDQAVQLLSQVPDTFTSLTNYETSC
jgi:hypothetical protein